MNIIFCRHGETEYNLLGKYQGLSDSPLTKKGEMQARHIGKFLKDNYSVQRLIISPLPRVKATTDIINKYIHAEVIIVPELIERSMGEWEGRNDEEIGKPELVKQREKNRFHFIIEGSYNGVPSESYAQVYDRIKVFLENEIIQYYPTNGDLVVVTHHGVMLAVAKYYLHLSDEETGNLHIQNNMIGILDSNHIFRIKTII